MALDRTNRTAAYISGRMIAIAEHYAGKKFGPGTLSTMFTHPQHGVGVWRRYIDADDEYYQELAGEPLPVTTPNEVEKSKAWVGYYHQKAAYSSDTTAERLRIGQRIAQVRKEHGMTQQQLADAVGVSREHIARIEVGKYSVGLDILVKVAKALDMELEFVTKD